MSNNHKKIKDCSCHDLEVGDLAELRLITHSGFIMSILEDRKYLVLVTEKRIATDRNMAAFGQFENYLFYNCLYFYSKAIKTFKIEEGRASFYPDNLDLPHQFCFKKIGNK